MTPIMKREREMEGSPSLEARCSMPTRTSFWRWRRTRRTPPRTAWPVPQSCRSRAASQTCSQCWATRRTRSGPSIAPPTRRMARTRVATRATHSSQLSSLCASQTGPFPARRVPRRSGEADPAASSLTLIMQNPKTSAGVNITMPIAVQR